MFKFIKKIFNKLFRKKKIKGFMMDGVLYLDEELRDYLNKDAEIAKMLSSNINGCEVRFISMKSKN